MTIKDMGKINARQMETLRRQQSREMARLEEGHQDMKAELKKSHGNDLVDIQNENLRKVASESEKKEKLLNQMKDNLEQTQKLTDKQIQELKTQTQKVKQTEHEKLAMDRDRVKSENDLYLEDLGYRFSKEHKKIVNDHQNQSRTLNEIKAEELTQNQEHFQNRINSQTNNFTTRFTTDSRNYQKIKDDQDKQFKTERANTNLRQQVEMGKLTTTHNNTIEIKDNEFRKGLKEQDLMFEKKYAETLKTHNDNFKNLSSKTDLAVNKLKDEMKEKILTTVERSDDPFYRFTELNPKMKQFEDRVEISVEVAEHAKQDVYLTINNKEAIINFNRRYDDAKTLGDVTNKLHKVESYTTRMNTNHHLDPKSVKSSYADGVMTYIVKHS